MNYHDPSGFHLDSLYDMYKAMYDPFLDCMRRAAEAYQEHLRFMASLPPSPPIPPGGKSVYKGQPRICTDGSTGPKGDGLKIPDANWQPYTALSKWTPTTITTLDAYKMPYVVMPGAGSANKGDKAILINWDTGQSISCIVGEVGNASEGWGKVSIAALWATGYPNHMTANHASGITSNYEIILYSGVSYGYDWSWGCRKIDR